jgi:GWxTD domain-containing protein
LKPIPGGRGNEFAVRFKAMNKRVARVFLCLALIAPLGTAAAQKSAPQASKTEKKRQRVDVKTLDPVYQEFLQLVTYIISPKEREVFLELPDNRDRDIFIEDFWKLRDPTPGTPENEYKDEIVKRFEHVNKYFAAGRPGWMTDRGRIWMILGEPRSYDRYPGKSGIIPCEVWYYYTDGSKGLPTHFGLVFFQKAGVGEYKLYDPFIDGPKALLEPMASIRTLDPTDYEGIYQKILEIAPTLAQMSISLIPGEFGYGYQPTSRSTELLASIMESPYKDLNPTYATHFFDFKGLVSTEYLTNYIENDGLVTVIRDPVLDQSFVHFSIVPQKLSVDLYEPKNEYFCDFRVDVSLRRGETVIFQYSRDFPITFSTSEAEHYRQNGIALEDTFPVCDGQYTLAVLVQNSVAKEFTVMERAINVPKADAGRASLNGPFLGYKVTAYPQDVLIPFKALDRKLVVDPKMTFASGDQINVMFSVADLAADLWKAGDVEVEAKGLGKTPADKKYSLHLADSAYHRVLNLAMVIRASDLPPDYYELMLRLIGPDKNVLDEKSAQFVVSGENAIAHPIANAKGFSLANRFYLHYQLARQYDKLGRNDRAEAEFAQGYAGNPNYKEGVSEYAHFLVKVRKFDQALTVVDGLKDVEKGRYDYLFIRGQALMGKGEWVAALNDLLAANKIYNSDTALLNAIGSCFLKVGQKEQALNAFQASLKLNAQQEDIQKIVDGLTKR